MCILISSTAHPDYPFILLSNRDEFLSRPTQKATLRDLPNGAQILSPLDLGRDDHGTWIGVTSTGRLAALVNYREDSLTLSKVSRGILPIAYLSSTEEDGKWYENLPQQLADGSATGEPVDIKDIGGFTLVYGQLGLNEHGKQKPLNIMSNRGDRGKIHSHSGEEDRHEHVAKKTTFSTSNSLYYNPWAKTQLAEKLLSELVEKSVEKSYSLDRLVGSCFEILSHDTYDTAVRDKDGDFSKEKLHQLQYSIFIPPLYVGSSESNTKRPANKFYGTRTQTIIVLDRSGKLHYYERDLYDGDTDVMTPVDQHFGFHLGDVRV